MFINTSLLFLQCLMHLMQMRDPSVIMGCRHAGSFLHHLDPNQQKCLPFSSADCKGHVMHHQKPVQKPQRLFAVYQSRFPRQQGVLARMDFTRARCGLDLGQHYVAVWVDDDDDDDGAEL